MWIKRDLSQVLEHLSPQSALPIKVLKGPRQVGKTSLLDRLGTHSLILFDDLATRSLAQDAPSLFFEQFKGSLVLDEATLAPHLFPEIKKRVDAERRRHRLDQSPIQVDLWVTGSNQTLLQKNVRESLAGRASYYELNTLSLHEVREFREELITLRTFLMRGGWPELYVQPDFSFVHYLNDFITTFIEKDIVSAAGIEKRSAFGKILQLSAGRVGQLLNYSDLSKTVGVDLTTVQSWLSLLEQNGIVHLLQPYSSNLNQRLIKAPKLYFEDVGLAVRLQGWTDFDPLFVSPYLGSLIENLALSEIKRFFTNHGMPAQIYSVRSKEKVEVDFLIQLPNQEWVAAEVKSQPVDFSLAQRHLLDSLKLNLREHWVLSPTRTHDFAHSKVICIQDIYDALKKLF